MITGIRARKMMLFEGYTIRHNAICGAICFAGHITPSKLLCEFESSIVFSR